MRDHFTSWHQNTASKSLDVHLLGCVDFDSVHVLQRRLAGEIANRSDGFGGLFVCEHPPIVTIGREGSQDDLLLDPNELRSQLLEVRRLNRGGGCLVHLPGQLAVYPIIPVDRLGIGLIAYRQCLENAVVSMCDEFRTTASTNPADSGVSCRTGRIADVGIAVRDGVTTHGLFVNVAPDMNFVRSIQWTRPGERLTSLSAHLVKPIPMHKVRESLIRHVAAGLGYDDYHLYTGHPLLKRTTRRMVVVE